MEALAEIYANLPVWSTPLLATVCILPVMTQVWPLKHVLAMCAIARGATPPDATRPKAYSDGKDKPSWGPLTYEGIKGMHYGDLFYAACGLLIYYFSWPDANDAKDWPTLDPTVVHSWVALVLARNLVLEVSFYELWHQLLFGAFANDAVTKHRYAEGSPYEAKPGAKKPQMNVWRERFWCTCGFICARPPIRAKPPPVQLHIDLYSFAHPQRPCSCYQGRLRGNALSYMRGHLGAYLRAVHRLISHRNPRVALGL